MFYNSQFASVKPINKEYSWIKDLYHLYDILLDCWNKDTCAPRLRIAYNDNITLGQCSITSFLIQDIFGGEVFGVPLPNGGYHCFNEVDGRVFDLTSEQFGNEKLNYDDYADVISNVIIDDKTQNYKMHCPETGAFLGYKKCFNNLLVTLLIPADARRVCSTTRPCRCDKAKVINITSFDFKEHYKEAWSLCSSYDFKYTLGEMVYPDSFNPDRWMESTHGIHFWMTMEEAMAY